ncbi:MAG: phosphotransferase [Bradyrhizobium sp.]
MPLHLALDASPNCVVDTSGKPLAFLKLYEPEALPFVDFSTAAVASRQAADLQLAPALLGYDAAAGAMLFDWLAPEDWRMAVREDLDRDETLGAIIGAKKSYHGSQALPRTRGPFDRIDEYLDVMAKTRGADGAPLSDARRVLELAPWVARIEQAFAAAGSDVGPTHGENTLSNVMLDGANRVRLVDFDRSENADPLYDLASFCVEFCSFREDVDRAVSLYLGAHRPDVAARVSLHMIVDDFLWGCWAMIQHFTSPRSGSVEFYKLAQNRFLRSKYWLTRWDVATLMRSI